MKKVLTACTLILLLFSCNVMQPAGSVNLITITGRVEKLGITTFRYGTHSIKAQGQVYSLKSASINLDNFLDRQVTLKGTKVTGYPVEGGPQLIEVVDVKGQ